MTPFLVRSLYQSVRGRVMRSREALQSRLSLLEPREAAAASASLAALARVDPLLAALRELPPEGQRIRVHGDLHLGHVLDTGADVVFLDFEGDSGQPLSERRLKRPALVDLASLVRSIHFAAHWPNVARELRDADPARQLRRRAWATFWFQWMSAACVRGYRAATAGAVFVPATDETWTVLFESLLVARAADELGSRLGRGPTGWGCPSPAWRSCWAAEAGRPDVRSERPHLPPLTAHGAARATWCEGRSILIGAHMSAAERSDAPPAIAADVDDALEFETARKGSAEELLDADAHDDPSIRCATPPHTSWPRRSWRSSRTRGWASGRPSRAASTTTSSCPGR